MKKWMSLALVAVALVVLAAASAGCSKGGGVTKGSGAGTVAATSSANTAPTSGNNAPTGSDADGDGVPDKAEVLLGTDPKNADTDGDGQNDKVDPDPLSAANPITETSTTQGFKIDSVLAENNVDAGGAAAPDHLEITVTNVIGKDIANGWDLYYTLTDQKTHKVQSFYMKLPGFSVPAGKTVHLHVDTSSAAGHFQADPNSTFYTGQNRLRVEATLRSAGFAPQTGSVMKDAAGAEAGGD